jgi:hypothetical protein
MQVLVHGPTTGVQRQVISLKRLALTPIKLKIGRGSRTKALVKAIKEQDMEGKWAKTAWARKLALRQKRASATDFDRFKLMVARRTVRAMPWCFTLLCSGVVWCGVVWWRRSAYSFSAQRARLANAEFRKLRASTQKKAKK